MTYNVIHKNIYGYNIYVNPNTIYDSKLKNKYSAKLSAMITAAAKTFYY